VILLGSVAAIIAGVLIWTMGWLWADAVGSILISAIIILGAWRLILDSVNVLLEGTPRHISLAASSRRSRNRRRGGVHDLHVWTISSGIEACRAHNSRRFRIALRAAGSRSNNLHERFGIDHLTIQMETLDLEAEAVYVCETERNASSLPSGKERDAWKVISSSS
jgi:cobalt-zinc-cadmium efflux system protein